LCLSTALGLFMSGKYKSSSFIAWTIFFFFETPSPHPATFFGFTSSSSTSVGSL